MVIDQRNAGAAWGTSINGYCVDRWNCFQSVTGKLNGGQNYNSITPPVGFSNYIGVQSQSAYSVLAADYYVFQQAIEGFNTSDLGFGTANAKTITLSFWVRSSLTGTFGGSIKNSASNRSYPFSYTITSANTWEYETITIAGDTSGTWIGATNGVGIVVCLGMGVGTTYSATAGSWQAGNYLSTTGATSVVGTNGATFYITGVQLEIGSSATGFNFRSIGQEQLLCMRYYQIMNSILWLYPLEYGGNNYRRVVYPLPVTMRAAPTLTLIDASNITGTQNVTVNSVGWYADGVAAGTVSYAAGGYTASSEL
jgi:hypothetical protein